MKKSRNLGYFGALLAVSSLGACQLKKPSQLPAVSCSSFSSNGVSYFDSASLCSAVPGNSNCVAMVIENGATPQTCYYHNASTSGGGGSTPVAIAFVSASSAVSFGNVSSTSVVSRRVEIKNNGTSAASGCGVTMGRSTYLTISGQIPASIPAGQTAGFVLSTVISSLTPSQGTSFSATFDVSCSNSNTLSGTVSGTFGSSPGDPVDRTTNTTDRL